MGFPQEERQPPEKQETKECTETRRTRLPEPIVGDKEASIALFKAVELLRKHVQENVVESDREREGGTVASRMSDREHGSAKRGLTGA